MLLKFITGVFFLNLFLSCNSTGKKDQPPAGLPAETIQPPQSRSCYSYITKADTILLNIVRKGDEISGTLVYSLDGKDRNTGTLHGSMKADILIANYSFMSEGIRSVRQVAFRFKDGSAVEGFKEGSPGDTAAYISDINNVNFNNPVKLSATDCQ
jgi:hypothetical protein